MSKELKQLPHIPGGDNPIRYQHPPAELKKARLIDPKALKLKFKDRIREYETAREFRKLLKDFRKPGNDETWTDFVKITDLPIKADMAIQNDDCLSVTFSFKEFEERKAFFDLFYKIYSTTKKPQVEFDLKKQEPPEESGKQDEWKLEVKNLKPQDHRTVGRLLTALFVDQFGKRIRQNIRLFRQKYLKDIPLDAIRLLPDDIQKYIWDDINDMNKTFGEKNAKKKILTSRIGTSEWGELMRKGEKHIKLRKALGDILSKSLIEESMWETKFPLYNTMRKVLYAPQIDDDVILAMLNDAHFGTELQAELAKQPPTPAQRPKGTRPDCEKRTNFKDAPTNDPDDTPVSGITSTQRIKDKTAGSLRKNLDIEDAENLFNLGAPTSFLKQIAINIGYAVTTYTWGTTMAAEGFVADKVTQVLQRRRLKNHLANRPPIEPRSEV